MFLRNYIDRFVAKKLKIPKKRNRIFDNDNYNAREHSASPSAPNWTRAGYNGKLEYIITEACEEKTQGEDSSYQETQREESSGQETQGENSSDQGNLNQETQKKSENSPDKVPESQDALDQENESDALSSLRLAYDSDGNTADIESECEEEIVLLTSEGCKRADDSDELEMDDWDSISFFCYFLPILDLNLAFFSILIILLINKVWDKAFS